MLIKKHVLANSSRHFLIFLIKFDGRRSFKITLTKCLPFQWLKMTKMILKSSHLKYLFDMTYDLLENRMSIVFDEPDTAASWGNGVFE